MSSTPPATPTPGQAASAFALVLVLSVLAGLCAGGFWAATALARADLPLAAKLALALALFLAVGCVGALLDLVSEPPVGTMFVGLCVLAGVVCAVISISVQDRAEQAAPPPPAAVSPPASGAMSGA